MKRYSIESKTGFYIGDICYVLDDAIYHGVWGSADYADGEYHVPDTDFGFAVVGTKYGDGCYDGLFGDHYGVDAGVIGIVPLELCEKGDEYYGGIESLGRIIHEVGKYYIETDDSGTITITDTKGEVIEEIETGDMWDYEDEDEEDDEW